MIGPLEISTRNLELTDEMEDLIREKAHKLKNFYNGIISCRVMVDIPHRSRNKGDQYNVRIDVTVPGGEVVVKSKPNEDLHVAIVRSFDVAERQLKSYAEQQRGEMVFQEGRPRASINKLFPEDGYGFLLTPEGREVYFHMNSVANGRFEHLKIGMVVFFTEEEGDKGPKASSVTLT